MSTVLNSFLTDLPCIKERKRRDKTRIKDAQAEMRVVAQKYGLTFEEAIEQVPRGKGKAPAKYRNPNSPSKTWSGLGRKPKWVVEFEEQGYTLDSLLIETR